MGYDPFTLQSNAGSDAGTTMGTPLPPTGGAGIASGAGGPQATASRGGATGSGGVSSVGAGAAGSAATGGGGGASGSEAGTAGQNHSSPGGGGGAVSVVGGAAAVPCVRTPTGREICDGLDNDCSGEADEGNACPATCIGVALDLVGYMVCDEPLPWPLAGAACVTQAMHLARVESDEENTFLGQAAFSAERSSAVWIEGNDVPLMLSDGGLVGDGTWEWGDGTRFWIEGERVPGVYENWAESEPPMGTSGGCAEMHANEGSGFEWYRQPCVSPRRFACERP